MTAFQDRYLRVFNGALRVVSWVWIVLGSLGALMSLMAASDGWAGTLAFVALCVAGILVRRALPLTNKHLKIFGFVQKKK
ncbi:MAG: hypothetical protein AB7G51_12750 [Steroidobacteraceae bacterium]